MRFSHHGVVNDQITGNGGFGQSTSSLGSTVAICSQTHYQRTLLNHYTFRGARLIKRLIALLTFPKVFLHLAQLLNGMTTNPQYHSGNQVPKVMLLGTGKVKSKPRHQLLKLVLPALTNTLIMLYTGFTKEHGPLLPLLFEATGRFPFIFTCFYPLVSHKFYPFKPRS